MSSLQMVAGIPMVSVPRCDGHGQTLVSRTPITNGQYYPVIAQRLGEGAAFVRLTRGLHGSIAVVLLSESAVKDTFGGDKFRRVDQEERIVPIGDSFLYKLKAQPSPPDGGFRGENQPVVCVSSVVAEGWCEMAGHGLHLLSRGQMTYTLTGGGKLRHPTSTGELFGEDGRRLLHGQLKRRDGEILRAVEGDPEFNTSTVDVEARDETDSFIYYPDGPFGTRLGGNVCLLAAGDLLFGRSWNHGDPGTFEGVFCLQVDPAYRSSDIGFCVGASSQD